MTFVINFDARQVAPNVAPEPVPSNTYAVAIIKSEEVPTKKDPGATFYQFTMEIIEGEFKGRTVTDRLNCKNRSEIAQSIAYATLSALCHVTNTFPLNNSQQLHGKPFKAIVQKVVRDDNPDVYQNVVRGYLNLDGSEPGKNAAGAAPVNPAFATGPAPIATAPAPQFAPQPNGGSYTPQFAQQPAPQPIPVQQPAPQPAPVHVMQPSQQPAPVTQPAPVQVFQRPDGQLVNAQGQPVDQYGRLTPIQAQPIPQQFQPQPTQQPAQQTAPSNDPTPTWAQ